MSIETSIKIREYVDGTELSAVADVFERRSWTQVARPTVSLSSGVTTEIETNIASYEYVYVKITGDAATVTLYFNNYPEIYGVGFDNTFHVWGISAVTKLRLKASADTTVTMFLAGT
jgi:hypothetical protein